jgi:alpha-L-fucosidase 2
LPALPIAWATGSVTGLRARGGITIDMSWANGKLISAQIHTAKSGKVQLRTGLVAEKYSLTLVQGGTAVPLTRKGTSGSFTAQGGRAYLLNVGQ